MLLWTAATFVNHPSSVSRKLPFFVDIVPHLEPNDGGPPMALQIMMQQWRFDIKPHIVADSGFGSFVMLNHIISWGTVATLSVPTNESNNLAPFLSYNLPVGNWRACMNEKGVVFSVECKSVTNSNGGNSIAHKYIVTNAFKCKPISFGVIDIGEIPKRYLFINLILFYTNFTYR